MVTFEHQEIKGFAALENVEVVINEDYIADESSRASGSEGTKNLQGLNIETPMKKDKGNKRSHDEVARMEVDTTTSSKRIKGNTKCYHSKNTVTQF